MSDLEKLQETYGLTHDPLTCPNCKNSLMENGVTTWSYALVRQRVVLHDDPQPACEWQGYETQDESFLDAVECTICGKELSANHAALIANDFLNDKMYKSSFTIIDLDNKEY